LPSVLDLVRKLTNGQWALLVLETAQGQVDNGGFFQFFDNKGEYLDDLVGAARLVGADRYLPLLERAVGLFPAPLPWDMEERSDYLDGCSEELEQVLAGLDDGFYSLGLEGLDLVEYALRYAERHPEEFFMSPEEADRDLADFLGRLSARTGARSVASPSQIAGVEQAIGLRLPELLRRLYLEVGNGGWGPSDGVLALGEHADGALLGSLARLRAMRGPEQAYRWPDTLVPFCVTASGVACVDLSDPQLEVGLVPGGEEPAWSSLDAAPLLPFVAASLRGWLEQWLTD